MISLAAPPPTAVLVDLHNEMHDGFAVINRRLDHIVQMQLDEHATRIKKLEAAVFSK
jgi:hypothetical protein